MLRTRIVMKARHCLNLTAAWPALTEQVEFTRFYRRKDNGLEGSVTHCLISVQMGTGHILSTSPSALPTIGPSLLTYFSPMFPIT